MSSKRGSRLSVMSEYGVNAQQLVDKQKEMGDIIEEGYKKGKKLRKLKREKPSVQTDNVEDVGIQVKKVTSPFLFLRKSTQDSQTIDLLETSERLSKSMQGSNGAKKLSISKKFAYLTGDDYDELRARHAYLDPDYEKELQKRYHEDEEGFANMLRTRTAFHKKWRKMKKETQAMIRFIAPMDDTKSYRSMRSLKISGSITGSSESSSDSYGSSDFADDEKSLYDLPLETYKMFLLEQYSTAVTNLSPRLSSVSGAIHKWQIKAAEKRSSRFYRLKPGILMEVLESRRSFACVRPLALRRMLVLFEVKLNLVQSNYGCDKTMFVVEDLPHKVFSWVEEDFIARRRLNVVWVDILTKAIGPTCLQTLKFHKDMAELKHFMHMFINAFLDNTGRQAMEFIETIESCHDFLQLLPLLEVELDERRRQLSTYTIELTAKTFTRIDPKQSKEREFFIKELECLAVLYPIELRYQIAHFNTQSEYAKDVMDSEEKHLQAKVNYYGILYRQEINRSQSTMNTYYVQIQYYRAQILTMERNYERECERVENSILRKRSGIEKLEVTKTFCIENLERLKSTLDAWKMPPRSHNRSTLKSKSHSKRRR